VTSGSKSLSTGDKIRLVAPILFYAVLAFVVWKLGFLRAENVEQAARSSRNSIWVGLGFVLIYGVIGALALPVGPLAYGAGAVFGFWRGSILIWSGSMLAAVAGYYLAGGILAKPARRLLGRYEAKLHDLRKSNVFLTSFRLQLMPLIPFGAFNYAAAISKLSPVPFFIGTAFGIVPGTLLAAFIGDRFAAGYHGKSKKPYLFGAAAALIMLGLSFAPNLWKKFHKRRR
jgi:uncharacterized membrane protein YdjX (TVP38/TMEM64 family)